jgi:ParB/RepB/Spo0J family partition protein
MTNTETTGKVAGTTANAPGIALRTSAYRAIVSSITRREGWNPRFDFGEIEELAKSIKVNGLLNPLRVKRIAGAAKTDALQFELIDGDRRLTALEQLVKAGVEFPEGVPVIIVDKAQDDLTSLFQMFEANTGKNFLPLEEAAAYQRMRDAGLTIKQICERVSRKQVHVVATLALITADADVQDAVKDGTVNSTTAKKIAQHARGDKAKQKELVAQAKQVGKDKTKKAALDKEIDATRRAKAAKTGKVLKMRALSDVELSKIGEELALSMASKLRDASKTLDFDLRTWVSQDDALALAFTFGALEALKAAAGMSITLDV